MTAALSSGLQLAQDPSCEGVKVPSLGSGSCRLPLSCLLLEKVCMPSSSAAGAFKHNTKLETLKLGWCKVGGGEGARALADLLMFNKSLIQVGEAGQCGLHVTYEAGLLERGVGEGGEGRGKHLGMHT